MATVVRERTVEQPASAVWAQLADFAGISAWAPNVDHSCLLSEQTHGPGTQRRIQSDGRAVVEVAEVWEPEQTLSYRITGLPPVIDRLTNTWQLDSNGPATTVTLTTEIEVGPRPPQQAVARLIGRRMATVSDQMLDGLVAHLGADAAPAATEA